MAAWTGGPCPGCGEDVPPKVLRCPACRMLLDPDTMRPRRVDLLDAAGRSKLIATHTGSTVVRGSSFRLPARVDVNPVGEPSAMSLELRDANTFAGRIKDKQFDLGYLTRRFDPAEVVELGGPG